MVSILLTDESCLISVEEKMINIPLKFSVAACAAMIFAGSALAAYGSMSDAEAPKAEEPKMEMPKDGEMKAMHHDKHAPKGKMSEEVKKELEEFHKKKKELWDGLSPEAKKAMNVRKSHHRGGVAKHPYKKPAPKEMEQVAEKADAVEETKNY